jgi:Helix-loop-helix DNA-binding domain
MAGHSGSIPYIKREPDELTNDPNRYIASSQTYHGAQQNFPNQFDLQQQTNAGIDPSELSMPNGSYTMPYFSGSQQNLSSSFNLGNSGYGEDELLESLDFSGQQGNMDDFTNLQHQTNQNRHQSGVPMNHHGPMTHVYSSTPDGPPIQSPFLGGFDYNQFRPMNSIPQHMSPHANTTYMNAKRPSMHSVRKSSDQRSPMTPKTPGLHVGTPELTNLQNGRPIRTPSAQSRQQKTLSGHYDSTPGSLHSYLDQSPMSSPGHLSHHTGISETLGSLPTKIENGQSNTQSSETVEAKKRRRRASHNAVERRRRDNINERIQDLSHLVPQHRLDDDKVKKQLQNSSSLSPTVGPTGTSPPNAATSLLAGANGRRAASTAGNITIGLPIEDKEKGPNKGDILNGAVSWTRDLMWALNTKYTQEEELLQYITQLGGTWPFEITEEEKRMRSEVLDAMEKNDVTTFEYSRADGTGLRVPRHTNAAGQRLQPNLNMSPQSMLELSPGFHSGGSGTNSGSGGPGQPQFWNSAGHPGLSFKEEDEDQYMELN